MSEYEAWLKLAEIWKTTRLNECNEIFVKIRGFKSYGLCGTIRLIVESNRLRERMIESIAKNPQKYCGFCWPLTEGGAMQRVAFCLRMAEREAWLELAERWKKVELCPCGFCQNAVVDQKWWLTGLCATVSYYVKDPDIRDSMLDKIDAVNPNGGYLWAQTPEGAKQRIKFCLERANELSNTASCEDSSYSS
jgi:hypothetical protein